MATHAVEISANAIVGVRYDAGQNSPKNIAEVLA